MASNLLLLGMASHLLYRDGLPPVRTISHGRGLRLRQVMRVDLVASPGEEASVAYADLSVRWFGSWRVPSVRWGTP